MPGTTSYSPFEALSQSQRRSMACGLLTGVVFVSAVVLARRVSGDASPIAEWAACLIATLAVGIAVLCATIPGVLREQLEISDRLLATGLASIPGLLLGLSLLPPGSVAGVGSLLGIYVVAVVAGTLGGTVFPQRIRYPVVRTASKADGFVPPGPSISSTEDGKTLLNVEPAPEAWPVAAESAEFTELDLSLQAETISHPSENPQTTHWMSRALTAEGENAEGGCQVTFERDQKISAVHLPFTPAFGLLPEFECEPLDESDVKIKISARQRFGVRIEVTRLGDLTAAQSIPLGWFAFAASEATVEPVAA